MRFQAGAVLVLLGGVALVMACSGSSTGSGFGNEDGGGASSGSGSNGSSSGTSSSSGTNLGSSSGSSSSGGSSGASSGGVTTTTVYAHTDTELYSLNVTNLAVASIGNFTGMSGGSGDDSITDLAVNAAGDVYVNSETVIYKAALPSGGTGNVALTQVATIAVGSGQDFYALAFTPKDALGTGTGEVLIGGDENGVLWSIDQSSGATKNLGSFGANPSDSSQTMELSGDVVFYMDGGKATGLATVRSCTTKCDGTTDYLVGIDMTALASAYSSGTAAASLNAGFYGAASSSDTGPGIGYKEVFGLGAWNGSVFGFTHEAPITLLTIATSGSTAGVGTVAPGNTSSSGWAGAGVTSSVTVTVAPPPIPPK
jgi:hypothetical protein